MSARKLLTVALVALGVAAAIIAWQWGWRGAVAASLSAGAALEGWRRARSARSTPPEDVAAHDLVVDDSAAEEVRAAHEVVDEPMQIGRSSLARELRGDDS